MDLCIQSDAHLLVLVISNAASPPMRGYASEISDAWLEERQQEIRKLEERIATVEWLLAHADFSASVVSQYGEFVGATEEIGRHGRYSDLG